MRNFLEDDRGQWVLTTVVLLAVVILGLSLVVDGGMIHAHYRRLQNVANLAAQAASHQIDEGEFRATNRVVLDPVAANQVARWYIQANAGGMDVEVEQVQIEPRRVTVIVRAEIPTGFWRALGIDTVTVRVRGQAYPAYGVDYELGGPPP